MPHPATLTEAQLLKRCEVHRTRGSGPGGQNRNKVETAIRLVDLPTGTEAWASERRSQGANKSAAVFRLRVKLAVEVREPMNPGDEPSEAWRSRVKGGRLSLNPSHEDFPTLLAEAMDRIAVFDFEVSAAAKAMGVSGSQLLKLLKHEPGALERVNAERVGLGLRPLR